MLQQNENKTFTFDLNNNFATLSFKYLVVFGECPDNWVANGNSCYYISDLHGGHHQYEHSWHEAESRCEYYGGTLVVIGDSTENVRYVLYRSLPTIWSVIFC